MVGGNIEIADFCPFQEVSLSVRIGNNKRGKPQHTIRS